MKAARNEMPAGAALSAYDAADYLKSPEDRAAYLQAVFEESGNDALIVAKALGDVAKSEGMQKIARETGLNREGLYQALSGDGNPSFATVLKVMNAVGVELRPMPAAMAEAVKPKKHSRMRTRASAAAKHTVVKARGQRADRLIASAKKRVGRKQA
jgi:probable addiction module antidote protein